MILVVPPVRLESGAENGARHIRLEAVVDETRRTVIAERMQRADTFMRRLVGLLGRDGLEADEALWISPCRGIHTMWMRFAIDAVFLDMDLKVVAVRENVAPWKSTGFIKGASSVLELPEGAIRRTALTIGDQIGFVPFSNDDTTTRPEAGRLEEHR